MRILLVLLFYLSGIEIAIAGEPDQVSYWRLLRGDATNLNEPIRSVKPLTKGEQRAARKVLSIKPKSKEPRVNVTKQSTILEEVSPSVVPAVREEKDEDHDSLVMEKPEPIVFPEYQIMPLKISSGYTSTYPLINRKTIKVLTQSRDAEISASSSLEAAIFAAKRAAEAEMARKAAAIFAKELSVRKEDLSDKKKAALAAAVNKAATAAAASRAAAVTAVTQAVNAIVASRTAAIIAEELSLKKSAIRKRSTRNAERRSASSAVIAESLTSTAAVTTRGSAKSSASTPESPTSAVASRLAMFADSMSKSVANGSEAAGLQRSEESAGAASTELKESSEIAQTTDKKDSKRKSGEGIDINRRQMWLEKLRKSEATVNAAESWKSLKKTFRLSSRRILDKTSETTKPPNEANGVETVMAAGKAATFSAASKEAAVLAAENAKTAAIISRQVADSARSIAKQAVAAAVDAQAAAEENLNAAIAAVATATKTMSASDATRAVAASVVSSSKKARPAVTLTANRASAALAASRAAAALASLKAEEAEKIAKKLENMVLEARQNSHDYLGGYTQGNEYDFVYNYGPSATYDFAFDYNRRSQNDRK